VKKLDKHLFKIVAKAAPLVSIDILIKNENLILLGKRINKPAKGYFFSIGGRIMKNETTNRALKRIMNSELNIQLKSSPKFIDIFEHFYKHGIFDGISSHYVGLLFEYEVEDNIDLKCLPNDQHSEYRWFSMDQIMKDNQIHNNVKDYFRE
jgi:colanic acid biosynthesis protein WcaH